MQWLKSGIGQMWPTQCRFQDSAMTVIAVSYSDAGFAIGADGRGTWSDGRHKDDEQKIFPALGENLVAAFAVTGVMANVDGTFSLINESVETAKEMQAVKGIVSYEDYARQFTRRVMVRMESAQAQNRYDFINDDGFIWRFLFCGYFLKLPFSYVSTIGTESGKKLGFHGEPRSVEKSPWGSLSATVAQLVYGNVDPRFSRYSVQIGPNSPLEDGILCVEELVEACLSPIAKAVDPKYCADLGGDVHVATVTPQHGFKWAKPPASPR
jgi:hypothetical protein